MDWGRINARWPWQEIRGRTVKVEWHKAIWFPLHTPKHSLIAWMAILNILPMVDRLIRMGIGVDDKCRLCRAEAETRSHVFFECSYTKAIWEMINRLCNIDITVESWDEELSWAVSRFRGKTFLVFIVRTAWCAYIYCIWEERNHRQFRGHSRDVANVVNCIIEVVRMKFVRMVIQSSVANRDLCLAWGIRSS
ncbi:uncharacterized protein LOC120204415 [Hibiscus syriacus]|uniref:uncharacterized protein LOC120204415 n=1 Tax=Hibiscus syriacus TaxID=106335 RepID=UPI0019243466|nr:uncharacterized protein LOC120204415 [Hibiscus syriacus]